MAQDNQQVIYRLLFAAASQTLLEFGRNPRWLGGELGISMVLHTWGQRLDQHIHVHCVVTGGALSDDGEHWIPAKPEFLFPVRALSTVFRGNRCRHEKLVCCRALLGQPDPQPSEPESVEAMMLRLTGIDLRRCPACQHGSLRVIAVMAPARTASPCSRSRQPRCHRRLSRPHKPCAF